MSDKERMDRAKRIREMRDGQRDEDQADGSEAEAAVTRSEPTDSDGTGGDADDTSGAAPDDGTTGVAAENATEVIENLSGTSASIPTTEQMEAAIEQTTDAAEPVEPDAAGVEPETPGTGASTDDPAAGETTPAEAPGPAGVAGEATTSEAETRVLEFTLSGERYCLDIEYIEEIVKQETVTRVPNTPDFVDGVVDLRGQITTILNPKVTIGKDDTTPGDLIVVFDAEAFEDQGAIGWVVDDVRQVSPVSDDQVNDPPMGEDYINGVIDREDDEEFVIWTTPDLALEEAE